MALMTRGATTMLPLPRRSKDRRELLTALTDTLTRHPPLRDLWLSLLYSLNPHVFDREVPAKYITGWTWLFASSPPHDSDARLETFQKWLIRKDPAWTPVVTSPEGSLWLMRTAEQCAHGRYHDPCRPSPLPFRGHYGSREEFKGGMIPIIRAVFASGKYPSVRTVAAFLKSSKQWATKDTSLERMIYRWCRLFNIRWRALCGEALTPNPPLPVSRP